MGAFLKIVGFISIIVGIIFIMPVIGIPVGVSIIFQGLVLYALGVIYDEVKELRSRIKE